MLPQNRAKEQRGRAGGNRLLGDETAHRSDLCAAAADLPPIRQAARGQLRLSCPSCHAARLGLPASGSLVARTYEINREMGAGAVRAQILGVRAAAQELATSS